MEYCCLCYYEMEGYCQVCGVAYCMDCERGHHKDCDWDDDDGSFGGEDE